MQLLLTIYVYSNDSVCVSVGRLVGKAVICTTQTIISNKFISVIYEKPMRWFYIMWETVICRNAYSNVDIANSAVLILASHSYVHNLHNNYNYNPMYILIGLCYNEGSHFQIQNINWVY